MTSGSLVAAGTLFPLGGVVALAASYWLVIRLERVADRLHLSEMALGLLVAVAADSPEITSAVSASLHGQKSIGAGVVLGSNVFNLAALLGLGAIIAGTISLHRRVVVRDGVTANWVAVMSTVIVTAGLSAGLGNRPGSGRRNPLRVRIRIFVEDLGQDSDCRIRGSNG